jgi:hypothetical protein
MTLSTLQSMNVNMADLAKAFTAKSPATETSTEAAPEKSRTSIFSPKPSPKTTPQPEPAIEPNAGPGDAQQGESVADEPTEADAVPKAASDKPAVDPMLWWGALTQQFQGIAAAALKDVAGEAMKAGMTAKSAAHPGAAVRKSKTTGKTNTKASSRSSGAAAGPSAAKKAVKSAKPAAKTAARSTRPAAQKRSSK